MFLFDIFLFTNKNYLLDYADDNTLYTIIKNFDTLKLYLELIFSILENVFAKIT